MTACAAPAPSPAPTPEPTPAPGKVTGESAQLGGLKITINDAYNPLIEFPKMGEEILLVELTLKNVGGETRLLLLYDHFYIQDSKGTFYKSPKSYRGWGEILGKPGLGDLELEPGESQDITLQFFPIAKDATGFKLFFKETPWGGGKRISIPLEVRAEGSESTSEPTSEPTPTMKPAPGSPSEVVVRFYTLIGEGNYSEAVKLIRPDENITSEDLKEGAEIGLGGRSIVKIEVLREEIREDCGNYDVCAGVDFIIYFDDGSTLSAIGEVVVVKINGEWKL